MRNIQNYIKTASEEIHHNQDMTIDEFFSLLDLSKDESKTDEQLFRLVRNSFLFGFEAGKTAQKNKTRKKG